MLKLKPLADKVVVKQEKPKAVTEGGILLPDIAQKQPKQGTVVAVGPGSLSESGEPVALSVKMY